MSSTRFETLDQWLAWMETLHPCEIDLGLSRIASVADRLDLYPDTTKTKVVTVAGTNGKGSCITTLQSLLLASDHAVGAFTSPHILRYNERIKINGVEVSDDLIMAAFTAINEAREEISLTYFEFCALTAFYVFKKEGVDFWLLEVGLGGRLDAVNIIDPDVAVITSIALDHMDWLGDTREKIAVEKAGITRQGIPVVCADQQPPKSLVLSIEHSEAHPVWIGDSFGFDACRSKILFYYTALTTQQKIAFYDSEIKLPKESISAALQVIQYLPVNLSQEQMKHGVLSAVLPGRFELIEVRDTKFFLDVAHNPAATTLLAQNIQAKLAGAGKVVAIVAMMKDKLIAESLRPFISFIDQWYVTEISWLPRSESKEHLAGELIKLGVSRACIHQCLSTSEAIEKVHALDTVNTVVFGSFFTVSEATQCLLEND